MDCNLTLVAPHDDQRLKLFVIDLNLEPNGTACSDWLQVFDGFQSNTLCGQRTRYWLRNSTQRTMHIHFNSDGRRQEKGFWLYYEGKSSEHHMKANGSQPVVSGSPAVRNFAAICQMGREQGLTFI